MKVIIDMKKSDLQLSFIHNNQELTIPTDIANVFTYILLPLDGTLLLL